MIILPIDATSTHYTFNTTIDDIVLNFRIDYNTRAATWYMEIYDEDEALIVGSRAIVLGYNIFDNVDISGLPDGFLFVDTEPTLESLGSDSLVLFATDEDLT